MFKTILLISAVIVVGAGIILLIILISNIFKEYKFRDENIRALMKIDLPLITRSLNIKGDVNIELKPNSIECCYDTDTDIITLGLECTQIEGLLRFALIHELLHKKGLSHDEHTESYGYYSDAGSDIFTMKVLNWIFNGGTKPPELMILNAL